MIAAENDVNLGIGSAFGEILQGTDAVLASQGLYKFSSYALARAFRDRAEKPCLMFHGDDDRFWVATARFASRLEAAGYEVAD